MECVFFPVQRQFSFFDHYFRSSIIVLKGQFSSAFILFLRSYSKFSLYGACIHSGPQTNDLPLRLLQLRWQLWPPLLHHRWRRRHLTYCPLPLPRPNLPTDCSPRGSRIRLDLQIHCGGKLLSSGSETCFGPSTQGAGIRYQNTSQIQILLASHFVKQLERC